MVDIEPVYHAETGSSQLSETKIELNKVTAELKNTKIELSSKSRICKSLQSKADKADSLSKEKDDIASQLVQSRQQAQQLQQRLGAIIQQKEQEFNKALQKAVSNMQKQAHTSIQQKEQENIAQKTQWDTIANQAIADFNLKVQEVTNLKKQTPHHKHEHRKASARIQQIESAGGNSQNPR